MGCLLEIPLLIFQGSMKKRSIKETKVVNDSKTISTRHKQTETHKYKN